MMVRNSEKFEDTKGCRKSQKERKYNGHKKKDEWTNSDLQNTILKDSATRTPLNKIRE